MPMVRTAAAIESRTGMRRWFWDIAESLYAPRGPQVFRQFLQTRMVRVELPGPLQALPGGGPVARLQECGGGVEVQLGRVQAQFACQAEVGQRRPDPALVAQQRPAVEGR